MKTSWFVKRFFSLFLLVDLFLQEWAGGGTLITPTIGQSGSWAQWGDRHWGEFSALWPSTFLRRLACSFQFQKECLFNLRWAWDSFQPFQPLGKLAPLSPLSPLSLSRCLDEVAVSRHRWPPQHHLPAEGPDSAAPRPTAAVRDR